MNWSNVGDIIVVPVTDKLWIVNAITQYNYGRDPDKVYVDYERLSHCFYKLNHQIQNSKILPKKIHFPKIGAGLAGGDWDIISETINFALDENIEKNLWEL